MFHLHCTISSGHLEIEADTHILQYAHNYAKNAKGSKCKGIKAMAISTGGAGILNANNKAY